MFFYIFSGRADFYPHNMQHETVNPFLTDLQDALEEMIEPTKTVYKSVDISGLFWKRNISHFYVFDFILEKGSYVQWNVNYQEWMEILKITSNFDSLLPYNLFIQDQLNWVKILSLS